MSIGEHPRDELGKNFAGLAGTLRRGTLEPLRGVLIRGGNLKWIAAKDDLWNLIALLAAMRDVAIWFEGALLGNVLLGEEQLRADISTCCFGFNFLQEGSRIAGRSECHHRVAQWTLFRHKSG